MRKKVGKRAPLKRIGEPRGGVYESKGYRIEKTRNDDLPILALKGNP